MSLPVDLSTTIQPQWHRAGLRVDDRHAAAVLRLAVTRRKHLLLTRRLVFSAFSSVRIVSPEHCIAIKPCSTISCLKSVIRRRGKLVSMPSEPYHSPGVSSAHPSLPRTPTDRFPGQSLNLGTNKLGISISGRVNSCSADCGVIPRGSSCNISESHSADVPWLSGATFDYTCVVALCSSGSRVLNLISQVRPPEILRNPASKRCGNDDLLTFPD